VPTVAAPITVSYNLRGVDKLQLEPATLAKIFSRTIKTWDAGRDQGRQPRRQAADGKNITVVHRSDGSGTTSNFTKYLAAAAPSAWTLGSGDTVKWAADTQGGEKNTGVATLIKNGDGAIGYVDFSDATASGLKFAAIKNKDGKFVAASVKGAQAALAGAEVKDDLSYNPLNAAGAESYPITSPTFLLVRTKYDDAKKKDAVIGFVKYLLGDGQKLAEEVGFAPLPDALKTKALAQLDKVS
jgi:phosphate transport system substrate-binding protein